MFLLGINVPPKAESNTFLKWTMCVFFLSESFRPVYVTLQSFKFIAHRVT